MAVMDEFREEREALKNGTPKEKLQYFWYYYKWHVIIALVVIIMIVSFVQQLRDRKDPAFYAVMLNASLLGPDDFGAAGICDRLRRKRRH